MAVEELAVAALVVEGAAVEVLVLQVEKDKDWVVLQPGLTGMNRYRKQAENRNGLSSVA